MGIWTLAEREYFAVLTSRLTSAHSLCESTPRRHGWNPLVRLTSTTLRRHAVVWSYTEELVTPANLSPSAFALGAAVVCMAQDPALKLLLAVALRALHPWI